MKKRRQPLALYITTMGTVLDGPLMHYYNLFTDAMRGQLRQEISDRLFAFICELAFDVFLKKQMIERLADELRDENPPKKKK